MREGNPENIQTWDDLLRDGIEVITPNPFTSGGAQWNIMAAYGAQPRAGQDRGGGIQYLSRPLHRPRACPGQERLREALQTFAGGKGDVMLAYENEAIFAKNQAARLRRPGRDDPDRELVAAASTSTNAETAQAFVDYLWTPEAQRIFAENGYRPVDEDVLGEYDFLELSGLFYDRRRGGWPDVKKRFFDREESIFLDIENELGVLTE